ncbi:shikimate dehydrogenase [Pseudodesulfovibrio tunisiensis]|uniref:shikimate dehydrogenase n=1 Tax=Pseudodesulfovibrio tunisiensis TaxID=463192 RepID=UPI001FB2CCE2|nr:shikimate dehydrogenase [Pseudodesulfovibrio tunisiensis]
MTRQYGIIGWPLGHTMSPALHNWGFQGLGLDCEYQVWPTKPEQLDDFMYQVRETPIHGLSVTIPHKQAVMEHLDFLTYRAKAVGAVNTLYWDRDRLCGENTDVAGFIAPLVKLESLPESALVMGSGGAARAAVAGLMELGVSEVAVTNRTRSRAQSIAHDFAVRYVDWDMRAEESPGLIVNCTPLGMQGEFRDQSPWDGNRFPENAVVYDMVYNPLETLLLRQARKAKCIVISGLDMFLNQGLAQFELWTGHRLDEAAAREVLLNKLAR